MNQHTLQFAGQILLAGALVALSAPAWSVTRLPATLQAEHYDSAEDTTAWNEGGALNSGPADIGWDRYNRLHYVGWVHRGEWLRYRIDVPEAGQWRTRFRVSTPHNGRTLSLRLDGRATGSVVTLPRTGGWYRWQEAETLLTLPAGTHTLEVAFDADEINLDQITFAFAGKPVQAIVLPARIEAEDYHAYHDTTPGNTGGAHRRDDVDIEDTGDAGGGFNVGWTDTGEWLSWQIRVPESRVFTVTARVATIHSGRRLHYELDGQRIGHAVSVPDTGNWQNWQSVSQDITLPAGNHTLKVVFDTPEINLNYVDIRPASPAPGAPPGWKLVWQDEFNGSRIDETKWSFEVNGKGGGNNELQYYTSRRENAYVSNGTLKIVARRESYSGPDGHRNYTSARLRTKNKGDWLYGRFEVRARLPGGQGLWPAIWMLPTDWKYGGWAASGEIDIMEAINAGPGNNKVYGTLHYGGSWPRNVHSGKSFTPDSSITDDFHVYALEWEPGEIRWYVDGHHYQTQTEWWSENGAYPAPFDKRFHMILNVAVGGNWPGSPNGSTRFPQTMEVDYVRVYQRDSGQGGSPGPVCEATRPWQNQPASLPGKIEAEHYDEGCPGVAYSDSDAQNRGGAYRQDLVDIERTRDSGGGYNLGWLRDGEWLKYTVDIREAGTYDLTLRVASRGNGSAMHFSLDDQPLGPAITVRPTGGWQTWRDLKVSGLTLPAGRHTLTLYIDDGDFNLNFMDFRLQENSPSNGTGHGTSGPVSTTLPGNLTIDTNGRVTFRQDQADWAIVHYRINNGPQQNITMSSKGSTFIHVLNGLQPGDRLTWSYTWWDREKGYAIDSDTWSVQWKGGDTTTPPSPPPGTGTGNTPDTTGTIVPLYGPDTPLEPPIVFDRGDALVTRFSDRARDRHAREDQFQAYDHYLTWYWEHRTASIEIEDYVAKGGDRITMTVTTQFPLHPRQSENRWFYRGINTVAEYHDNGIMDRIGHNLYRKSRTWNAKEGRPIRIGDRIEFEISQFLDESVPHGRANYYGTTYLYVVGKGLVPWETRGRFEDPNSEREDSFPIPEKAWLGGQTTLPYNYSNEPDNHFQQMATNLGFDNGQPFVLGRRLFHTDFETGEHDEPGNPVWQAQAGKAGPRYINALCSGCHVRNGRAAPRAVGVPLDQWVFRVSDSRGDPDPDLGRVIQPAGALGEGQVRIRQWLEQEGLRKPDFQFDGKTPDHVSPRIAPQLVGLGLLEAITEETILSLEDPDDLNGDGISGRARRVTDPETGKIRLGRYGYTAAMPSLRTQIAAALNTDMGVTTSVFPAPDCGANQSDCGPEGTELDDEALNQLVKYVALLGVRPQRDYDHPQVKRGQQLFNEIQCAACHVPTLKTGPRHPLAELRNQIIHPYTDLLLHDMGPGLADSLVEPGRSASEWRTPPLWGIGLGPCVTGGVTNPSHQPGGEVCQPRESYLHDGRARTLDEAIRWHGGEAEHARAQYEALGTADKQALIHFLKSL